MSPDSFHHYTANVNGIDLHYVREGSGNELIVLCHGWPDLWYGWRCQIKALASAGYSVVAPDLRGFGGTDAPPKVEDYTYDHVTDDLAALVKLLGFERAIFLGHDWGGEVVWKMCLYHPQLVSAVGAVCTPYTPRHREFIPLDAVIERLPSFAYQKYLASPAAPKELNQNPDRFFRVMFRSSSPSDAARGFRMHKEGFLGTIDPPRSPMLSQQELDYYVQEYSRRGFEGGLNWYKTREANWIKEERLPRSIEHPALMVTVGKDFILTPAMSANMEKYIPHLKRAHVEEAGHWVLVERSKEVNEILLKWLRSLKTQSQL